MLNWFKKPSADGTPDIRDTLFGDMPLSSWGRGSRGAPWDSFAAARRALEAGRTEEARTRLQDVVATPDLESRHHLEAWHALRSLGTVPPAAVAKQVLGVVVEVDMKKGLDLLAGYRDLSARYYNYSGGGVVWERPDPSLDPFVTDLLEAGQQVTDAIGPWEGDRPARPKKGRARINMLTPSGLHFGEGPFEALSADPLGGRVITAGTALMLQLMAKAQPI